MQPPGDAPSESARETLGALMQLPAMDLADAFFASLSDAPAHVDPQAGLVDPSGDHVLNPDFTNMRPDSGLKPAAVLIAVDMAAREPEVTLTVRTSTLSAHAGQIAFPGGRMDPGESPLETALREASEEVALPSEAVQARGFLPTYASRTGYRVYPVVGALDGLPPLQASPAEVEQIFQVPLRFLLNPANAQQTYRVFEGKRRYFYTYTHENYVIWGLTAGIIHHMSEQLVEHFNSSENR